MIILYGSINSYSVEHGRAKQIYHRLAEKQNVNITWVDPPEPIVFRNVRYGKTFLQNLVRPVGITADNINTYAPVGLNFYLSCKLAWLITEAWLNRFVSKLILTPDLIIVASPIFLSYAKKCREKGIPLIYDCRDFFAKWPHVGRYARSKEEELIRLSNLVVVPSFALADELTSRHGEVSISVIPNGVPESMVGGCQSIDKKSRPQIGYIGFMGSFVDLQLLIEIAKIKQDWDFVFVGDYSQIRKLVNRAPANCKFLGEVRPDQIEGIVCDLDVGTIPFVCSELTDVVFPIKLVEYLGKGKPVVSTPLREVDRICGDLVYFAESKDGWIHCLEAALADKREREFIDFARKYTWEDLTERYYAEIGKVLAEQSGRATWGGD